MLWKGAYYQWTDIPQQHLKSLAHLSYHFASPGYGTVN